VSVASAGSRRDIPLLAGDRFRTASGRITGPFPKAYKNSGRDERALRQWLKDEAIAEAQVRGDRFNLVQWQVLDIRNWSPADGDAVNLYLFDDHEGRIGWRKVDPAQLVT
jgi:hypothetical protein